MKHNAHQHIAVAAALLATISLLGCDKRTPEEKGRDYAKDKLGFVEGATDELAKRGKVIGADLGKGVGELVKGTGSAVKDVTHPPVEVRVADELKARGLSVGQANEGEDSPSARNVVIHLKAEKDYSGKLVLSAKGENNAEVQAQQPIETELSASTTKTLRFAFDSSVRLSKMKFFELRPGLSRTITLAPQAEQSEITLNQLSEEKTELGHEVSVYAQFAKSIKSSLSMRAYDASHQEVGRSAKLPAELHTADSAGFITFVFDPRTKMDKITSYELYVK